MRIPNTDLTIPDILFKCPLCNCGYWNKGSLSLHVKRKHPEHYKEEKRY